MSHPRTRDESVESSEGFGRKVNWLTPAKDYVKLRVHGLLNLDPETKEAVKHLSHRQIKAIGKNNILQNFSAQEIKRLAKIPAGFIKKHIDTITRETIHITDEKAGMLGDSEVYSQISDFPLHLIFSPLGQKELLLLTSFKKAELEEMMKGVNKNLIEPITVTESKVSFILKTLLDGVPKRNKTEFLGAIGILSLFGSNEQTLLTLKGLMGKMTEVETGKHIEVPLDTDGERDIDQDPRLVKETKITWSKNRKQMKKIKALDKTALVNVAIPEGTLEAMMNLTPEVISALGSGISQATPEQLLKFQKNVFSRYMYGGYEKLIQVFSDNFKVYDLIQFDKPTFKVICGLEIEQVEQLIGCIERLDVKKLGYLKKMSAGALQYLVSYLGFEGVVNLSLKTLKKLTKGLGKVVDADELKERLVKLGIERIIPEVPPIDERDAGASGASDLGEETSVAGVSEGIELGEENVLEGYVQISNNGMNLRFLNEEGKPFYKNGEMLTMMIHRSFGIKSGILQSGDNVEVELRDDRVFKIYKIELGAKRVAYQRVGVPPRPTAPETRSTALFDVYEVLGDKNVQAIVKYSRSGRSFRLQNIGTENEIFTQANETDLVIPLDQVESRVLSGQIVNAEFEAGKLVRITMLTGGGKRQIYPKIDEETETEEILEGDFPCTVEIKEGKMIVSVVGKGEFVIDSLVGINKKVNLTKVTNHRVFFEKGEIYSITGTERKSFGREEMVYIYSQRLAMAA